MRQTKALRDKPVYILTILPQITPNREKFHELPSEQPRRMIITSHTLLQGMIVIKHQKNSWLPVIPKIYENKLKLNHPNIIENH